MSTWIVALYSSEKEEEKGEKKKEERLDSALHGTADYTPQCIISSCTLVLNGEHRHVTYNSVDDAYYVGSKVRYLVPTK